MSKKVKEMAIRCKSLLNENDKWCRESSLDKIFSPGCYVVEIDHTDAPVGLPVDFCGAEHYIVGHLLVTDSGTSGPKQQNRVTGQVLTFTTRTSKTTKMYTRTFSDGTWSKWHSFAETGMYDNISGTDELLSSVSELVKQSEVHTADIQNLEQPLLSKGDKISVDAIQGFYWNGIRGEVVSNASYQYADNVDVKAGDLILIQGKAGGTGLVWYYDTDGILIYNTGVPYEEISCIYAHKDGYMMINSNIDTAIGVYKIQNKSILKQLGDLINRQKPVNDYANIYLGTLKLDTVNKTLLIPQGTLIVGKGQNIEIAGETTLQIPANYKTHYLIADCKTSEFQFSTAAEKIYLSDTQLIVALIDSANGIVQANLLKYYLNEELIDFKPSDKYPAKNYVDNKFAELETGAAAMAGAIEQNSNDIEALKNKPTTVVDYAFAPSTTANFCPRLDTVQKTLTLPKGISFYGNGVNILPIDQDIAITKPSNYSTHYVVINGEKTVRTVAGNEILNLNEGECVICLVRWETGIIQANFWKYWFNDKLIDFKPLSEYPAKSYVDGKFADLESADAAMTGAIETAERSMVARIDAETTRATAAEQALQGDLQNEVVRATNSEAELLARLRGTSGSTQAMRDPFKWLGDYDGSAESIVALNSALDALNDDRAKQGCYRFSLAVRPVELFVSYSNTGAYVQVAKGLCIINANGQLTAGFNYAVYSRTSAGGVWDAWALVLDEDLYNRATRTTAPIMYNPPLNLQKEQLRVLDIGNSYTQDATHYLPQLISAAGIDVADMCLYTAVRGSASFKTWYDCYHDKDTQPYSVKKVCGGIEAEISGTAAAGNGEQFRNLLENNEWDLIIIHQVSTYAPYYDRWEENNNAGFLSKFIRLLRKHQPKAAIGFLLTHSYWSGYGGNTEGSSLERWRLIAESTKKLRANYGIDFVIPYGTAIQNLRASSLNNEYDLTADGTHCANGLADYTASCAYFQSLFAPRYGVSVLGNSARVDVEQNEQYPSSDIDVTDETAPVAQAAAFLACYNWYECQNPEEEVV